MAQAHKRTVDKKIENIKSELALAEQLASLWANEQFRWWFEERMEKVARVLALRDAAEDRSFADRKLTSGLVRFVNSKRGEFERYASQECHDKLRKELEQLYARSRYKPEREAIFSGTDWHNAY